MADKAPTVTETYVTKDRADARFRAQQGRTESAGAITELMLDLADLKSGDHVLDVAARTGESSISTARRVGPNGLALT